MQVLDGSAALTASGGPGLPTNTKTPPVNTQNMTDWNDYTNFLDKKGLKGSPALDHNDLGGQMIDEYRKQNPQTTVSRDMVVPIQQAFSKYRDYAIKNIEAGKGAYAPGTNKDNFLKNLSVVDGIPGQRTTSFQFPSQYMKDMNTGVTTNQGFATTQ
jgi:hypothetical protein